MPTFTNAVSLAGNELRNARIQNLGVDPGSPTVGTIWYNTGDDRPKFQTSAGARRVLLEGDAAGTPSPFLNAQRAPSTGSAITITTTETAIGSVTITRQTSTSKMLLVARADILKDAGTTIRTTTLRLRRGTTAGSPQVGQDSVVRSTNVATTPYGPGVVATVDDTIPDGTGVITYTLFAVVDAANASTVPRASIIVQEQYATGDTGGGGDAPTLNGQPGSYYLARANHTGTQALSTITGHDKAAHDALGIDAATVGGATPANLRDRATHTGTQALATITGHDKAAHDALGIDAATTGGASAAQLRDRTTHTGSQAISTVTNLQAALDGKIDATAIGAVNGVASLDSGGRVPAGQIPELAITRPFVVASQAAMLALTAQVGDVAIRTDINQNFILSAEPASTLGNWVQLAAPASGVSAVTGAAPITSSGGTAPEIGLAALGIATGHIAANAVTWEKLATAVQDLISGSTRKFAATIGDGTTTTFTLTHNLGTRDVTVAVYANSGSYERVEPDIEHTTTNTITVRFSAVSTPAANAFRVVVVG